MTDHTTPDSLLALANELNAEATVITQVMQETYDRQLHAERDQADFVAQALVILANMKAKRLASLCCNGGLQP
ncbi:MAG TPA: hypothetical protein VM639_24540 [Dongiaceae bacterium]|nr:hypothetical protein [Dongiaceae bacterium]